MIELDRQRILEALGELSRRLAQRGATAELCLFGGAAMILDLVEAYYPGNLIQPKTQYFVEAVLEEIHHENHT